MNTRGILVAIGLLWCVAAATGAELPHVDVPTPSALNRAVPFHYRAPASGRGSPQGLLILVPGHNGDGRAMLGQPEWTRISDRERLVLVGPTFETDRDEIHARRGYYYPELWSGRATLRAIEEIGRRTGARTEKVMFFGFSAGAHFVHRFANWQPERVRAFVAYSAAWWDEPSPRLARVPALIMCGEEDLRYGATHAFMARAQTLKLPWIWRGYAATEHAMTPAIQRMAEAFLSHHARRPRTPEGKHAFTGDLQTYEAFANGSADAELIPEELRVHLPDKALAEIWKQEE